ncbi:topoisomerase I [Photobacterium atrarenae]|uniref:Topoisomerase I n=1 Tax=Photobacterium atrarenae TaxID=865757 RepID=A0ABY5GNA9_9GAMM|nr:topoisomerase I [Photobacterium atrarenae]UTV30616.1 topoisomerase I [Photobacterium atrarenae]
MVAKKQLLIGTILAVAAVLGARLFTTSSDAGPATSEITTESPEQQSNQITETPIVSSTQAISSIIEPNSAQRSTVEEANLTADTPWLSTPLNELSNALYDFIETEQVRYINTTDYPFDEHKQQQLRALAKQGELIMFDNTEPDYLDSYGVSETQVVSEYFGTASEGDVIIATGVPTDDGGIHYLVLPLLNKNTADNSALVETVKEAVTLLKAQKTDLVKPKHLQ